MRKSLRRLQIEAQRDLAHALELARHMMADDELKTRDRLDAMEFIRRCAGVDKLRPRQGKGPTITVVRATEAELLERMEGDPNPDPEPESGTGAPREQIGGSPDEGARGSDIVTARLRGTI